MLKTIKQQSIKVIDALRVSGKNASWNDDQYFASPNKDYKELRYLQPDAYETLKDARFGLLAAFCGWGKSTVQVALAIYDIKKSKRTQKQLIIVPQSHIHRGFVGDEDLDCIPIKVDGIIYNWLIGHNFCEYKSQEVLQNLKKWLLEDPKTLVRGASKDDRIITGLNAICSHQALGLVWNQLTLAEKKKAIHKLTLRVDEAHHIKGVFDVSGDDLTETEKSVQEQESNNLGNICHFIFNSADKTSKMCLTTATPYRGDRAIIMCKDTLKKFAIYYLDWIEHWKTLGIEEFYLQYQEYYKDPIDQIVAKIKAELNEKHMIVVPPTTQKWREDGDEVKDLFKAIYKVVPRKRVLDLVTFATQAKNKELLLKEPKNPNKGESKYDVVVTCMVGREGTDWCPCSRLHNTACENSVTLAVQTMGRPFRRYVKEKNGKIVGGKTSVRIFYYVPRFIEPRVGLTKRELLSDRTNALLICMQLDEMCHPILIPKVPNSTKKHAGVSNHREREYTSLSEIFGDQYQEVKETLISEYESRVAESKCQENETEEGVNIDAIVGNILDDYKITENIENVHNALKLWLLRALSPKLRSLGIDVEFLRKEGFDKILKSEDLVNKSIFFGNYKGQDWEIIRGILKNTWEENFELWKKVMTKVA